MTKDQKKEIIASILEEVHENGSARVGYHADKFLKSDTLPVIPYNIKSKIRGTIIASKKYISVDHPNFKNDFEILVNSAFEEKNWIERNPVWNNIVVGLITAVFSLIVGWLLLQFPNDKLEKRIDKLESTLKITTDSLNSLKEKLENNLIRSHVPVESISSKDSLDRLIQ